MKFKFSLFFLFLSSVVFGEIITVPADKIFSVRTFESLTDVLKQIEKRITDGNYPKDGITVLLDPGYYQYSETICLGDTFRGTKEAPIIVKVKDGGKAIFSGGRALNVDQAGLVTDAKTIERLAKNAVDKVYRIPIADVSVQQLLSKADAKLSMNGRMMSLSRFPNVGFTHIDKILDEGAIYAHGRTLGDPPSYSMNNKIGGVFTVANKDISKWETEYTTIQKASVTGYLAHDWYRQYHQIGAIDSGKIKLLEYSRYGIINKQKIPRRFYVSNLLCELDSPGEFYYDENSQSLLFWPFDNTITKSELTIWAGKPFVQIYNASNIRFENIIIENVSEGKSVVEIKDSENIELAGCVIRNSSRPAVIIEGGQNCGIQSCDIYDVPHHITLGGGNILKLTSSNNYAKNCHFTQVQAAEYYGQIQVEGVGQIFQNNLVHNFIGQIMTVSGNDHLIEFNEFFNIGIEEGDGGTIYSGAQMSSWGNVIRNNFLHHLMCIPQAHPRGGIYPDDRDQGEVITKNIFYKAAHRAILVNGGAGQTVTSNIFLKGHIGIYNIDRGAEKMYDMQAEYDKGKLKRGDKMDYIWKTEQVVGKEGWNKEPWKSHYPKFAKIMNQEKRRFWPIECITNDNCFCENKYNTQFLTEDKDGKRLEMPFEQVDYFEAKNNRDIDINVFKSPEDLDFSYKTKFENTELPDIDFSRVGLYSDEFRKNAPNQKAYRSEVKKHFNNRLSFDENAKYDPLKINDDLYFNTGKLIFGLK